MLAINRLCAPGSELAIERCWYPTTALDDPLKIEEGKLNDTRLYRCLDRILPQKTELERLIKAHVMVSGIPVGACFASMVALPGDALWVTLKHLLKRNPVVDPNLSVGATDSAQPMSPIKAIALLSTLKIADIVLPTSDGREIRLRRITEPTLEQKPLLRQLGIILPEHVQFNGECSVDSATA